jgi:hypothetical protein
MKYWEIIADNLSKARWSWGCVSAVDSRGRTIWIADAHRDDGKRFVVRADEKLTASLELERVTRESSCASDDTTSLACFSEASFIPMKSEVDQIRAPRYYENRKK